MADTALKFGPEWLRALTEPQGGSGGVLYTPPLPNMKLADYRYGREEMLALFDKNVKPPEDLAQFGTLFVEKCQFPLNLMQMSEEESRAWQRGANSDASLRPYGPPGKRPPSPSGGRGRGRGRGTVPYYDRNRSMDDEMDGVRRGLEGPSVERGFPRGPARNGLGFERQSSERGWFDRGTSREEDLNGVVSPRKGYTRAPFDDWRRGGDGTDTGTGQGSGGLAGAPSQGGSGQVAGQGDTDGWRTTGARRWGGAGAGLAQGQGWRSGDRENNYSRSKFGEGGAPSAGRPGADRWRRDGEDGRGGLSQRGTGMAYARQRSRHDDHLPEWATDDPSEGGSFDHEGKFRAEQQRNGLARAEEWGGEQNHHRWEDEEVDPEDIPENGIGGGKEETRDNGLKEPSVENPTTDQDREQSRGQDDSTPSSWDSAPSPTPASDSRENSVGQVEDRSSIPKSDRGDSNTNHLETLAGNLVSSLVDEDDSPDPAPSLSDAPGPSLTRPEQGPPPSVPSPPPPAPSTPHTWSYLDPQHQVQGPFQSDEMFEWFSAGYFPSDLMVRRSCDQRFASLTDLTKLYGRVPFTPGPVPPPLTDNQEEERLKQQQAMIQQQLLMQQQLLAHQQQQQMLAMQQQAAVSGHNDINKLLQFGGPPQQHHTLGSLGLGGGGGGHHQDPARGYPTPDPLRNLLGSLGPTLSEPNDPLKQLLQRNQSGPSMPGLGRPSHYSNANISPPLPPSHQHAQQQQVTTPSDPFQQSLFGLSKPHPAPHNPTPEQPPLNIPFSKPPSTQQSFDPIQSLLAQLAGGPSQPSSPQLLRGAPVSAPQPDHQNQYNHRPPQSIWDMPPSEQTNPNQVQEKPLTSIWNDPLPPSPAAPTEPVAETQDFSPEPTDDCNDDLDQSESNSQEAEPDTSETDPANFVKPKANEKKDKKSKRAEEKRRAKEAKKAAEVASGPYIPGMTGTVKPEEQIVATGNINDIREEEKLREQQEAIQRQREQMEALAKLQEDQKARLEREEMMRIQQEKLAKLAPWAKKETSPVKEPGQGLTLQEIQRMEAERERKERQQREVQEARIREEQRKMEEEERARRAAKTVNWATVSAQSGGKVKSLAEIQAEEARVEKERQERENAARSVRSKDAGSSNNSSIWGGTKTNMSWAGKIAANTPTPPQARANGGNPWATSNGQTAAAIVAPAGFWDPVVPDQPAQTQQQQNKKNNNKNKKKKAEEEQKVKQIFNEKKPKNDFEEWCSKALQGLQAQVDIPTFLGFLMDIESPYEVHDYVKSYVGEGKAQKKFAVDYLERRSRWKNSLKSGAKYEDDLTTPANALTPGEGEFQFQEAGKKGKKTKAPKTSKSKQDISHLLGFSVTGQGVNRGELDMPQ